MNILEHSATLAHALGSALLHSMWQAAVLAALIAFKVHHVLSSYLKEMGDFGLRLGEKQATSILLLS